MHRQNLLFILRSNSVLLSCLFANAAVIPPSLSILPAISPITHSLGANTSTLRNPNARCVLPLLPSVPVSLEACQSAFRGLLASRSADFVIRYYHDVASIQIV